jgi:hypothetical protein
VGVHKDKARKVSLMDKQEALWATDFRKGQWYERERILELLIDASISREELIEHLSPPEGEDWR